MQKLHEYLKVPLKQGDVGIEIECEGEHIPVINSVIWKQEDDGSLRGLFPHQRSEFVLGQPIHEKHVKKALKELADKTKDAKFDFSFRTSVHVHVNVMDLTHEQLMNLIYIYLLLEEPLVNFCGKQRKGNRFCLRLQDAEAILETINRSFSGFAAFYDINENNVRYAAINLGAVRKYGSIEFRSMRGTMDQGVLATWVTVLLRIRSVAKEFDNVEDIFDYVSDSGIVEFSKKVFKEYYDQFVYPDMERDMNMSVSLSYDIPYTHKKIVQQREKKPAKLEELLVRIDGAKKAIKRVNIVYADLVAIPFPEPVPYEGVNNVA